MKRIIGLLALIFTLCLSLPAMAADPLPAGFIALAPERMDWNDAKAYCASKGGKLPLMGGKNKLSASKIQKGTPVDGFGALGAKWPSGLPENNYWTGTGHSTSPNYSWVVVDAEDGSVSYDCDRLGRTRSVVCVPKGSKRQP